MIEFPPLRGDRLAIVTGHLGAKVKFSLKTCDPDVAKVRIGIAEAHLQRLFESIEQGAVPLTHKQIIALSGEVYRLLKERFEDNPGLPTQWGAYKAFNRAILEGRISQAPPIKPGEVNDNGQEAAALFGPDLTAGVNSFPLSEPTQEALERRFGLLTSWVLTRHGLEIDAETRTKLLKEVGMAAQNAGWQLRRNSEGDYRPDPAEQRFPPMSLPGASSRTGLLDLFEGWARERKPSARTVSEWRKHVHAFIAFAREDDARHIRRATVVAWKDAMLEVEMAPRTINGSKLAALRKVFAWGVKNERIASNPAAGVSVDYITRMEEDMEGFSDEEAEVILVGASKKAGSPPLHWIPLLCATSGARVGEIAQLRAEDVFEQGGMPVMRITNEAGSVKNRNSVRVLPLHPAVMEAGFLAFTGNKTGPLFFGKRPRKPGAKKPPHEIVAKNVARWVYGLGIEVGRKEYRKDPNHGWRHRFTTLAREMDVQDSVIDLIKGNAPDSVSRGYGTATLNTMRRAIELIPVPAAALKGYNPQGGR
jgi:integrase